MYFRLRPYRLFSTSALLVVGASVLLGCAQGYDQARQALEAKDYERVESIADDELDAEPDSPWANQLMAESLVARGEYRRAREHARKADDSGAFPARTPALLGDIHLELGDPVDAARAYHRAREEDAQRVDDDRFIEALERGIDYAGPRGFHDTRWKLAKWLQQVDPDHPQVSPDEFAVIRRAYAVSLRRDGEYVEAVELLEQALKDDPEHLRAEALDLGEIYARLEMDDDARRAWMAYLDEDVDDRESIQRHVDVAEVAARHNLAEVAVETLQPLPDKIDDPGRRAEIELELARHQFRSGQTAEGRRSVYDYIETLTGGVDDGTATARPYLEAADLAAELNDTRLKINVLERAIEQAEPDRDVSARLADLYAHRAQLDDARRVLEFYIDRHDATDEAVAFAGQWARQRDNFALARHYLERAVEYDDAPPEAFKALAEVYAELDERDAMNQAIDRYLQRRDHADDALSEAGDLLLEHERFDEAERLLRRLHRRGPQRRSATRQLADLYYEWSRPEEAADVWKEWIRARGDNPDDITAVAGLFRRYDDLERSARMYHRGADEGEISARLSAADVHLRRDDYSAMSAALEQYVDEHPDRSEALSDAVDRYGQADMPARQIDLLTQLVQRRPDNWRFQEQLATLLIDEDRADEAFEQLHRFVERADEPGAALQRIGSRLADGDHGPRLLDFYRPWYDDERVHPVILRLVGDAYHALYEHDDTDLGVARHALERARSYYLDYLDATDVGDDAWDRRAEEFHQRRMWRPAVIAYEREADRHDRTALHSLGYVESLLQLGEATKATDVLDDYFQAQRRDTSLSGRIAELLIDFSMYDHAEQYASNLLISGSGATSIRGFQLLAEIHQQREDFDALKNLVDDFLERTGNTNRSRRTAVSTLEELGQWELAAEHLGELDASPIHQSAVQAGFYYYHHGDRDRAFQVFEEAAHHASEPQRAWLQAARFLADRGDVHGATDAFDRALSADPDDLAVRTARGSFAIRRGDVTTGFEDYQFARQSTSRFDGSSRRDFFDAFADIGHVAGALTVARHFEEDGETMPNELRHRLGRWYLHSADPDVRQEGIGHVNATTWGMYEAVRELDDASRYDDILRKVEDEIDEGDPTTGAALLLNWTTPLSRLVSWEHKRDLLDVVTDPLATDHGRMLGPIGDHRLRSGEHDDGLTYLRAAIDHGDDDYLEQYAHTRLINGDIDRAFDIFEQRLEQPDAGGDVLASILLRFELAGKHEEARRFLNRIAAQPAFVAFAMPRKVHYDLEHHADPHRSIDELFEVVDSLHQMDEADFRRSEQATTTGGLSREGILDTAVLDSLAAMASLGFADEVEQALSDAPIHQLEQRRQLLELQLALTAADSDDAARIAYNLLEEADDPAHRRAMRLELAEQFIAAGADDLADEMIDDALDEQDYFDDHRPFLMQLGLLHIRSEDLDERIDEYLDRVPNRHDARAEILEELQRLGRDDEALRLAVEAAQLRPTTDMLLGKVTAAFYAGDRDVLVEAVDRLFEVADDPVDELTEHLLDKFTGAEAELTLPVIERVLEAQPQNLRWNIVHARVLFDDGQTAEARDILTRRLAQRGYNQHATTKVVEELANHKLDVEILRVIAPEVPTDELTPQLMVFFAEAALSLDDTEEANQWLDALTDHSDASSMWLMELGDRLIARQLFEQLQPVVTRLDEDDTTGPYADFLGGVYQLRAGSPDEGMDRIQQANAAGIDRFRSHYAGIQAALQGGERDIADQLMVQLLELPVRDGDIVSLPAQAMLTAARGMPDAPSTVHSVLQSHRPRLLQGDGAAWTEFTGQLARILELTDDHEGAYGFYRDRLWQARFVGTDTPIPTYLNNLAFSHATTDHDIDAGLDMIRRAVVLDDRRSPSFIDTLGWLKYRDGDLEGAEAEIRRALRSYDRSPPGLREMLNHLRIINEERGIYDRAALLENHYERLPVEGFDW